MTPPEKHPYSCPEYYDLAWSQGQAEECRFFLRCFEQHASRPVQRLLEPACGTGRLLLLLARAGLRVRGVDLDRDAVDYCNARFRRNGQRGPAVVGDMTALEPAPAVDVVLVTNNSFRHLLTEDAARSHLASAARALRPGGLYVAGLHLVPTKGQRLETESWVGARGGLKVETRVWTQTLNRVTRREHIGVALDVHSGKRRFQLDGSITLRTYTARQMQATLRSVSQLRLIATYDFRYEDPVGVDSATQDVIYVLRKDGR
ncbi:MAG: class I SAM-dependent methyltransferase [Planctomycetota bacterium]